MGNSTSILNVRGGKRTFEIYQSHLSHYRVSLLKMSQISGWMPLHLFSFAHVRAFETSTKTRSLSIERIIVADHNTTLDP